jgi:hypothetical protein
VPAAAKNFSEESTARSHRELHVWQKAKALAVQIYPPSGVKLRASERRYKPYIVVLLVRYRLDNFPADLLFII